MINIGDVVDDVDAYELFDKAEYVVRVLGRQVGTDKGHRMYEDTNFVIDFNSEIDEEKRIFLKYLSVFHKKNYSEGDFDEVYKYVLKTNFGASRENPENGEVLKYIPGFWKELLKSNYSMALVN